MSTKKKSLLIASAIVVILVIAGIAGFLAMGRTAASGQANLEIHDVDMTKVSDGSYEGEADAGLVYVKVRVTVQDHAIADIELLEHKNGMGEKAEVIVDDIAGQNRVTVDSISGATLSSDTIKSAVTNALEKGISD